MALFTALVAMPERSMNNFSQYMKVDYFEPTKFNSGTQTLTSQNMRMDLLKKNTHFNTGCDFIHKKTFNITTDMKLHKQF
jgi:hypothetical protein